MDAGDGGHLFVDGPIDRLDGPDGDFVGDIRERG